MTEENENLEPEVEENDTHVDEGDVEESHQDVEDVEGDAEPEVEGDVNPDEGDDWEPNYNYRFNDEDYEMDERLQGLIKDRESNELIRELVEKAEGLPQIKEQRQNLRDEISQLRHTEQERQAAVHQMTQMIQQGDIRSFTKAWGITPEQIREMALEDARVAEMEPHERQAYERNLQAQEQTWSLQQQNQRLTQQYNQMAVNQRESELQQTLGNERYAYAAQVFDERAGRPGAFREEIIRRGQYYAQVQQRDVSPHQLADEIMHYMGPVEQQAPQQAPQHGQKRVVTGERKPTLPQVRAGSASPVKGKVKSIADIKKLADQFATG